MQERDIAPIQTLDIQGFKTYLSTELRCSPHTISAYMIDITQAISWSSQQSLCLIGAQTKQLRQWIIYLAKQGLKPTSINRKISALRTFYRFSQQIDPEYSNPATALTFLKCTRRLPVFVKESEMARLFRQHIFPDNLVGTRDKCILELLYGTGIRLGELIKLRNQDIDTYRATLKVFGKRNKERIIPLSKHILQAFNRYQKHRQDIICLSAKDTLLVSENGMPITRAQVYYMVKRYLRAYTHTDRYSPHVLRHTFATHLLHRGANLNAIKELLGHTSLSATQHYTHYNLPKLQQIFEQAHPRGEMDKP